MDPQSKSQFFQVLDGTVTLPVGGEWVPGASISPGEIVEQKYKILDLLGQGGMGTVYTAKHLGLDKIVALKTFRSIHNDRESIVRFQREAQAIAKLNHPHIVQVFDYGIAESGSPYYTMEYLEGSSLADAIASQGPLAVREAIILFMQMCDGLAAAHSKGLVHRDVKPSNIFLTKDSRSNTKSQTVKVVDFGIVILTEASELDQRLTSAGKIFGSPLYMSPEQSAGGDVTEKADIYSLGCTFFETLAGKPPFRGRTALETIMQHQGTSPASLMEASGGISFLPQLEHLVATMLAKSPEDRTATVNEVHRQLQHVLTLIDRRDRQVEAYPRTQHYAPKPLPQTDIIERASAKKAIKLWAALAALLAVTAGIFYLSDQSRRTSTKPNATEKIGQNDPGTARIGAPVTTGYSSITQEGAGGNPSIRNAPSGRYRLHPETAPPFNECRFRRDLDPGAFYVGASPRPIPLGQKTSLILPVGTLCSFRPSDEFVSNPDNFDIFPDNFFYCLDLSKNEITEKSVKATIAQILRHPNIETLKLDGSAITDSEILPLGRLTKLTGLGLDQTKASGRAIAKLPNLRQFKNLGVDDCADVGLILTALKGSLAIERLHLNTTPLNSRDYSSIATLKNLKYLSINSDSITPEDFRKLTSLQKLEELNADGENGATIIPSLRILAKQHLRAVQLNGINWDEKDKILINRLIPKVEFKSKREKLDTDEIEGTLDSWGEK